MAAIVGPGDHPQQHNNYFAVDGPGDLFWGDHLWHDRFSFFSQSRISMRYHRSVVSINIYPLRHGESFHRSSLVASLSLRNHEKWCGQIVTASSYYVTQVAKCT